jgi:hypothetical protein
MYWQAKNRARKLRCVTSLAEITYHGWATTLSIRIPVPKGAFSPSTVTQTVSPSSRRWALGCDVERVEKQGHALGERSSHLMRSSPATSATLYRYNFFMRGMEANEPRRFCFIEMAPYRLSNRPVEGFQVLRFGKNGFGQGTGGKPALGRIFNYKNNFAHRDFHSMADASIEGASQ